MLLKRLPIPELSPRFLFSRQQLPGGIGLPCGQVAGCPKKVQILSVNSALRMCSNWQAFVSTGLLSRKAPAHL